MQHQIGKARRRRVVLALALSASVMQVLGCALPSLVICHRADRPPRLEFFSDSCSCRQADPHSCSPRGGHDAPCLEDGCTDVHLKSHTMLTVAARRLRPAVAVRRLASRSALLLSASVPSGPRPVAYRGVLPKAESPPPLSPAFPDSRLRC